MPKKYKITPLIWCVKDEASTKFHIKNNDYFGTIATVLSLIKQQIKKDDVKNAAALEKTLKNLETDLLFLQKNYQINPKIRNKNMTPKGKLKSQ
jgi:hypothetical protein